MTAQQVFDQVAAHLLRQGVRSFAEAVGCAYRGDRGKRCAVGCLIPDDLYRNDMEGSPVGTGDNMGATLTHALAVTGLIDYIPLLRDLQNVHDGHDPHEWRGKLRTVARDFDLSAAILDSPLPGAVL